MARTLRELANATGAILHGEGTCTVDQVMDLRRATPRSITFLSDSRYLEYLTKTQASAVILREENLTICPTNALVSSDPYLAYARVAALLHPPRAYPPAIDPTASVAPRARVSAGAYVGPQAVIEEEAIIGDGAVIGPGCVVERGAVIGLQTRLLANVSVGHHCVLGERVLVHPGAVIGADGFGFANDHGTWVKIPQIGKVRIGDDVEIGANTTIDRGSLDDTVIEDNVKIDNLVQVAHNVRIGAHTAIAGCVGIAGSAKIGKRCTLAGGVGVVGHLVIADDVHITGMSMVTKSLPQAGVYSAGTPLQSNREWHRNFVRLKQLDAMARRLRKLEQQMAELKALSSDGP